jgi:hypothetical protein
MDLDRQIQALIDHAPQDGSTPSVIQAITPALKSFVAQLQHLQYYILQTADQRWVTTTLSHRLQPKREKTVIYAFASAADAAHHAPTAPAGSQVSAVAIPVTHILFQMLAMPTIDSVVFFENAGDPTNGTEVSRSSVSHLVETYLQKYRTESRLPPDIA